MSENRNPFDVQVGQIWRSADPRDNGRSVEVLEVDLESGKAQVCSPYGRGPKTRIRLDRFRPNSSGYKLVETG